ncbi:MAG: hypothetical protein ACTSVI_04030 [Promethearchaeota archaeon]
MIEPDLLERNRKFVIERLEHQLKTSLNKGEQYIDQELSGAHNFLIRPIVKTFYNTFAKPALDAGSRGNIQVLMDAAMEVIKDEKPIDDVISKYFPKYLQNDETAKFCNKHHKNYSWLVENVKKTFRAQLEPLIKTLIYEGKEVRNYDELVVKTFKTREEARKVLSKQIQLMEDGFKKIESDPNILNIAVGKNLILRVIKKGIADTKEELLGGVDDIFDTYG